MSFSLFHAKETLARASLFRDLFSGQRKPGDETKTALRDVLSLAR
jgi:hypothetical protein